MKANIWKIGRVIHPTIIIRTIVHPNNVHVKIVHPDIIHSINNHSNNTNISHNILTVTIHSLYCHEFLPFSKFLPMTVRHGRPILDAKDITKHNHAID